jgi:O-antigen/teichoic acid export membrane protein
MIVGTLASLPRAAHRFDITSRITLVASLTLTLITVGIVGVGRGIREIAAAELTVTAVQLPLYWRVCRSLFPEWEFRLRIDKSWLRRLLEFGGLAALGNLAAIVFVHVNRILVGRFLGTAAVTYFTVPWSITARLTQVVYSLAEVVAPLASSLSASDASEQLERLHRRVSKVALLICGTIAIPLFLTAPDLLRLWMGPTFAERGGNVLRLLAVSVALQSQAMVTYLVLTGMGRAAAANVPAMLGAFVNLLVALLVGPRFGLVGLTAAVLMGVGVQLILLQWSVGRAFMWHSIATVEARQVAAAAVGATVVGMSVAQILSTPWTRLAVLAVVGIVTFHGLLVAFGAYSRPEREVLLRQIRSVLPGAGRGPARRPTPETDRPDRLPSGPPSA